MELDSGSALTDEQRALRDLVREFVDEEVRPRAREADVAGAFPEAVWDGLADLDLTGLTTPTAYGGLDADRPTYATVNEEVAYGSLAVATALSVHCLATSCIATFGDEAVREAWLPEMAAGRPVGAFALSEPGAGSNPAELSTVARRDGEAYVIDGEKQWITNGERAGVYVLFAKVDPADPGSITQFLVPADRPGLEVGPPEEKLGLRASDTTGLRLDGVRIPASNRLTAEGAGLSAALAVLTGGRIGIAAQSVGLARAAFDAARSYVRGERADGAADRQSVRHRLAEMATRIRASRLLVRDAARRDAAGEDARVAASMAKYDASRTATAVANAAVDLHGTDGYLRAFDVERLYRDAKVTEIYEGTTEIQKRVIADGLLGVEP